MGLLCLMFCSSSYATWYQGTAQQALPTINYDLNAIRTTTIKKAITNASFKSGALISIESVVLDGLLQSSKSVYKNKGSIRRVEILSETINDNILTITVNVNVNSTIGCHQDEYSKSIIVAQFPLFRSLQASNGELFDIGSQVSRRLETQLREQDAVSDVQLLNTTFASIENLQKIDQENALENSYYLATKHSGQFIIFGYIQDVSLFEQVTDNLLIDDVALRRNFTFQLFLYDAFQSKILINSRFHGEANWNYDTHEKIDTHNSVFWRSDYGRVVLNTINDAVIDINDKISCQASFTQIIHQQNNEFTINLGSKHGVAIDDEFTIIKRMLIHDNQNNPRPMLNPEKSTTLHVKRVSNNNAILVSDSNSFVGSNLLYDIVSPKGNYLNEE